MINHNLTKHESGLLKPQGLYDPRFEHDACGVGMICHMKGEKSHRIIADGLQILVNLTHRGACGCDETTGDGAGILIQMPHDFLKKAAAQASISLPEGQKYASGLVFLPPDANQSPIPIGPDENREPGRRVTPAAQAASEHEPPLSERGLSNY